MTYQLLPAARADLIQIGDFIALDNPGRALSFIAEIEATMATIASGRAVSRLAMSWRPACQVRGTADI